MVVAVGLLAAGTDDVAAQHHHHHGHGEDGDGAGDHEAPRATPTMIHAGIGFEAGEVEAFAGDRRYQGAMLMASVQRGRFEAGGHVPFYRIDLGAATGYGLGDIHLEGRWIAHRRPQLELGLFAGVMPPFGDDDDGLGMGHWMLMAGGLARASRGRVGGSISFGYGGAPGGGGHAEHGVPVWPPVSPMNAQELRARLGAQVALGGGFAVTGSFNGAVPLGDGDELAAIGAGVSYQLGRLMLTLGARHGVAAHTAGLVVSSHLMASF